jgi:hypothetical protein
MPLISEFFGISIFMYWNEPVPPHFHASYSGFEVLVDIENAVVLKGAFPARQLKLVLAWCEMHETELMANWSRAKELQEMLQIDPLR